MAKYDEDLSENPFFKTLLNFCQDLKDVAALLVPQVPSLPGKPDLSDLKCHILVQKATEEPSLKNLNGDLVILEDSSVKFGHLVVPILFNETHYYGQDWEKVKVLCIQRPLSEASFEFQNDANVEDYSILDMQGAINVWKAHKLTHSEIGYLKRKLDEAGSKMMQTVSNNCDTPQLAVKKAFGEAMAKIKHSLVGRNLPKKLLHTSCAAFFYQNIYPDFFLHLCAKNQAKDAAINQKILTADLKPYHDDLRPDLRLTIPASKAHLTFLASLSNPQAKCEALGKLFSLASLECTMAVTSDDLLPWLVLALSQCQIFNLFSQLEFMELTEDPGQQDKFNLATLEAALAHLSSLQLQKHPQVSTTDSALADLFTAILDGDLDGVHSCLEQGSLDSLKCHPLCDCDKCCEVGVNFLLLKDDLNLVTPLSLASWVGQPLVVELILNNFSNDVDIEEVDKHGRTALHLAAFNGHQNALLLLLNAKADANAKDSLGNSPIHYSAGHGHESCTKALLYTAEHQGIPMHISARNFKGDTALHLAAKRGFKPIVKLLLEYGASREAKNHQGETPVRLAHNSEIRQILLP